MNTFADPPLSPAAVEFLGWAADDFTEAFALRAVLRRVVGELTSAAERKAALAVLKELLAADLIRVGVMRSDTADLHYWKAPWPELLARLEGSWSAERPPEMGEGPWFYATEKGTQLIGANQ